MADIIRYSKEPPRIKANGFEWVYQTSQSYAADLARFTYVDDHYTGNVLQDGKIADYLIQRAVAETDEAFEERCKIAGFTPHISVAIDKVTTMLQTVPNTTRYWHTEDEPSTGLGDPFTVGTPAHNLRLNMDGDGTGHASFWYQVGTEVMKYLVCYLLVEGAGFDEHGEALSDPKIRIVPPQEVRNQTADRSEYILTHYKDLRTSLQDNAELDMVQHFTHYTIGGWVEYKLVDSEIVPTGKKGTYEYYADIDRTMRRVPIVPVVLPLRRDVAYMGARQSNRLFNTESEEQFSGRLGRIPRLVLVGDDDTVDKIIARLAKGDNVLQQDPEVNNPHYYLSAPTEPGTLAASQVERYRSDFYTTMFQQYEGAASKVTATEIRQKARSGLESILSALSDALDTAENDAMFLMEQAYYPDNTAMWGHFFVERSKDFAPEDPSEQRKDLRDTFFYNKSVPLGTTGEKNAAVKIAESAGITVDETEIEEDIAQERDRSAQGAAALSQFGLTG